MQSMTSTAYAVFLAAALTVAQSPTPAVAHPHVWVTMKSALVYTADGAMTGVRHAWTFDDMFSAFATQGLEQKTKGIFTREELAPLAEVNVTSLKEFDYFTYGKADGKKETFAAPKDYWLDFKDGVLTLHFTLPLKAPVKAKSLVVEVYDPSYFVDFAFAQKDAVTLAGAPENCKLSTKKLDDASPAPGQTLSESLFNNLAAASTWGAQFANRIVVSCQ
jgi:ABC-type uncharacterized transport system substrate-binding protein